MAKKVQGGWVAEFNDDFAVEEDAAHRKKMRRSYPTAIFVHGALIRGGRTYLNYAGTDANLPSLEVPSDPEFLRDLASAIIAHADAVEAGWFGS